MLGLNFGEWFVVLFVVIAVLIAPYVPRLGEKVGQWFSQ